MNGILRVLGLHPRNIANALERHKVTNNSSILFQSLLVRKHMIEATQLMSRMLQLHGGHLRLV
jgi:hypothetical protein